MLKRPHYIALGLIVFLTVVILNLPAKTSARLKLGLGSVFVPLFGLARSVQQTAAKTGDAVLPRSELIREKDALRAQNDELRLQLMQAEGMVRENERLRQQLGWQPHKNWKVKPANVVLREPSNWWRTVQIDLGSRDGVKVNFPVLTPEGLVGRISAVSLTRSQVALLGDPSCKVAARVDNPSRDTGVIGGSGPLDTGIVEMGYLSRTADLKPGQDVWTSGLGGIFPKDIFIGKVLDSRSEDYGMSTTARVKLAANLSALEEVWVMMEP
ncbi:MAG TPA: rod shape-determining protein MreC [Verrucomicrobiae bacterium]|nr:rod shape-determining protein MreC [Verrucomicrobiae bacterium]